MKRAGFMEIVAKAIELAQTHARLTGDYLPYHRLNDWISERYCIQIRR